MKIHENLIPVSTRRMVYFSCPHKRKAKALRKDRVWLHKLCSVQVSTHLQR